MTEPSVLESNRRRGRVRRVLLLATAPLAIVALLLCGKLLSMYAFAHQSASAYAAGDYAGTTQAARGQELLNWFEAYKAPFNVGVGLADAGELRGARAAFEESLALAHGLEQCVVRVNLAIVLERTGDAALRDGDPEAAAEAWQQALVVSQDAPEGCGSSDADATTSDPERELCETMDEQQQRLREKLEDGTTKPDDPQEQTETPDASDLDDIKDQLEQGAQDRDDRDQGDGAGAGTDRPW
ncbi:MAG: hypothetical protein ACTHMQ_01275 [Protaetiibacter sp.]